MATQIEGFASLSDVSKHRAWFMATNIGNPAFRMALRTLLVCGAPGGCASRPPQQLRRKGETHIFVAECAEKTLNFFNKVLLF